MSEPVQLDPDEVSCPRCHAEPGQVCRQPNGRKAKRIHAERRAVAADQQRAPAEQPASKRRRPPPPATRESRAKGGKAKAAKRRRERAEIEALLVDAKARALLAKAEELAEDSVEWDRRRMALKRLVLDTAVQSWATLAEAVEGYGRIQTDEQGKPLVSKVETDRGKVIDVLDRRGTFGPDDVKALAIAAGVSLDKVRLEEGSATSRSDVNVSGTPGAGFAEVSDAELRAVLERASESLAEIARHEGDAPDK